MMLIVSVLLPFALALLAASRGSVGRLALRLAPWAAAPALAVALVHPSIAEMEIPWLLLGTHLGLDEIGRSFLLFTALLWTAAGVYAWTYVAEGERRRFFIFFLLSLSGNLGLVAALDLASFYLFFALMTFSAYGLIVHVGGREAMRAGRVYIGMAVLGEATLLAGGIIAALDSPSLRLTDVAASIAGSPDRDLAMALLFIGFGIKAGVIPLHVWLPLAHPVAPTPASAVLSGAMIEAGVLGWLRFLPLGMAALPEWGAVVIAIGLVTAFFGVAAGVFQSDPKTILAYSSISQIGLIATTVGVGLFDPAIATAAVGTATAYALHHGLVKGGLFLGAGTAVAAGGDRRARAMVLAGLAFLALALAGAPLTSGGVAKHHLVELAHSAPPSSAGRLLYFLPLTMIATTLLMGRFLQRAAAASERDAAPHTFTRGLWLPWLTVVVLAGVALWILPGAQPGLPAPRLPGAAAIWSGLWPVLAGAALFAVGCWLARRTGGAFAAAVPAGDVVVLVERAGDVMLRAVRGRSFRVPHRPVSRITENWYAVYANRSRWSGLLRAERYVTRWGTAGLLFVIAIVALLAMLYVGPSS